MRTSLFVGFTMMSLGLLMGGCASSAVSEAKPAVSERFTEIEKSNMSEAEKLAAYNKYRDEDNKLVCTREVVTGSHFRRNRCRTVAERRAEREAAQEALDRLQRSTLTGPDST